MNAIEPNWISLIWFAGFATVCGVVCLIVAGMLPLEFRSDDRSLTASPLLVLGNVVLLAILVTGTGLYGYLELRWTTMTVVSGLVFLFAPALIEEWRWPVPNATAGLSILVGTQVLTLAVLARVGGSALAILS